MHCFPFRVIAAAVGVLLAFVFPVPTIAGPELGSRVRIQFHNGASTMMGSLLGIDSDSLRIVVGDDEPQSVALAGIASLESQVGVRTHVRTGAVIGMLVGLVGGAILGYEFEHPLMQAEPTDPESVDGQPDTTLLFGIVGGLIGTGLGAGVGSLIETEAWEPLPVGTGVMGWARTVRIVVAIHWPSTGPASSSR